MKPINKHPSYLIDESGNVWSTKRKVFLKPDVAKLGYRRVTLCDNSITKRYLVHRLVAEAYIPLVSGKDIVNHIDSNPNNNHFTNLEWCTLSENTLHGVAHGDVMKAVLAGSKAAKDKNDADTKAKFMSLLGDRFHAFYIKNRKRYVTYACQICSVVRDSRTDCAPFRNRAGVCNSCSKG